MKKDELKIGFGNNQQSDFRKRKKEPEYQIGEGKNRLDYRKQVAPKKPTKKRNHFKEKLMVAAVVGAGAIGIGNSYLSNDKQIEQPKITEKEAEERGIEISVESEYVKNKKQELMNSENINVDEVRNFLLAELKHKIAPAVGKESQLDYDENIQALLSREDIKIYSNDGTELNPERKAMICIDGGFRNTDGIYYEQGDMDEALGKYINEVATIDNQEKAKQLLEEDFLKESYVVSESGKLVTYKLEKNQEKEIEEEER